MGSKREKYPEKCPWDLGPNQHLAKEENWTLRLGEANVCFSKNKLDNNYFHVISNENDCLLYTSPSPRDRSLSRMPSSA